MSSPNRDSATWSLQEGVDFELAQEILAELVALAGRKITAAQGGNADAEVARWEALRADWSKRRLSLYPTDAGAVQSVLTQDGATLRSLRQES